MQTQTRTQETADEKIERLNAVILELSKTVKALSAEVVDLRKQLNTKELSQQIFDNKFLDNCENGTVESVTKLLDSNINILVHDESGRNALHVALCNPRLEEATLIINLLTGRQPDLFYGENKDGLLPIQAAAKEGKLRLLFPLYSFGQLTENPVLFDKVYNVATEEVKAYLLKRKLIESAKRQSSENEDEGNIEGIQDVIAKGVDVNLKADDGETALYKAVYNKYKGVALTLLQAGADPTTVNHHYKDTALDLIKSSNYTKDLEMKALLVPYYLLFAAAHGNVEGMKKAIAQGADFQTLDTENHIILQKAISSKNKETLDFILLLYAEHGNVAGCEAAISAGADIEAHDLSGKTVLDKAISSGKKEILNFLLLLYTEFARIVEVKKALAAGADFQVTDAKGQTILHKAVQSGNKETINFVLQLYAEAKINITQVDKAGKKADEYNEDGVINTKAGPMPLRDYLHQKHGAYKAEVKYNEKKKAQAEEAKRKEEAKAQLLLSTNFIANVSQGSKSIEEFHSMNESDNGDEWEDAMTANRNSVETISKKL